jgi:hypothetical protein
MSEIDREKLAKALFKHCQRTGFMDRSFEDSADKIIAYYNEPEPSLQAAIDLLTSAQLSSSVSAIYDTTKKAIQILEQLPKENVLDKYREDLLYYATVVIREHKIRDDSLRLAELVKHILEEK